jgi:hypothetical protein
VAVAVAVAAAAGRGPRGRKNKIDPPSRHPTFFSSFFLFSTFLEVFFRQGEFKNTTDIFVQKVHVENFFKNVDKNFDVSFSSTFLCFIAFSRVFQRWEFKNTTKNVLQKKSCRNGKGFYKKFGQKSKSDFFSVLFYHVFGRFSVRGVKKHDKKKSKKQI